MMIPMIDKNKGTLTLGGVSNKPPPSLWKNIILKGSLRVGMHELVSHIMGACSNVSLMNMIILRTQSFIICCEILLFYVKAEIFLFNFYEPDVRSLGHSRGEFVCASISPPK